MQIQEVLALIKEDMHRVEDEFKKHLLSDVYLIRRVGEYILNSGGKRFRPLMVLLASRLCGYQGSLHIPLAVVVEFIHTATLLHDDVVDNATLRRGRSSANAIWGNGSSVLVGDYLLSKAFSITVAQGNLKILDILSDTTTRMAEGEVLQLIKHSDVNATEEEYLHVITNKTAVLFSACCRIPAVLAGLSEEKENSLATYGMSIGIAYQLMDDCLDYTSKAEDLGKSIGNDLKEGKVTLPLIKAYRDATDGERETIREAVEADDLDEETLGRVLSIIRKYGGIEYTLEFAKGYINRAKSCLEHFAPNTERAALSAVADYVIERTN